MPDPPHPRHRPRRWLDRLHLAGASARTAKAAVTGVCTASNETLNAWRAGGAVRPDAEAFSPVSAIRPVAWPEIASELRRGADYLPATVPLTVRAADVADGLARYLISQHRTGK
jgi:hypothetical protein